MDLHLLNPNIIQIKIELIFEIIKTTYNLECDLENEPLLEYLIFKFVSGIIFLKNNINICLIQEFDKIIYNKISNDVINYKFNGFLRIFVSQFANKIHNYLSIKKKLL
jgi:hypothetical protein